jgi:hypothetical protein
MYEKNTEDGDEHMETATVQTLLLRSKERNKTMTIDQSIHFVRARCRFLAASYQETQEGLLSHLSSSTDKQQAIQTGASIAAYDLALCCIQRLRNIVMNCDDGQRSAEHALCLLLEGLTREVLFLGNAKEQPWGGGPSMDKNSPESQHYHQAQAEILWPVLLEMEAMLVPVFTRYVTGFMVEEQIQALDAQPYWSDITRRTAVAEVCQRLSQEGKLDATYAVIASELGKIDFLLTIYSEENHYRYGALPAHVRRLLVRDLLAFIARLKVESFAAEDAHGITIRSCAGAAQSLVERQSTEVPMPPRSMWVEVSPETVLLLPRVGIVAVHPEPCLLCSTHDGHCDCVHVTFPQGTTFGQATQTAYDLLLHAYTFTPLLPSERSDELCIYVGYCGIWEPDRPWKLTILDPNEE